jgi:hypothetical protein
VRAIGLCIAGTSLFFLSTAAIAAPAPEGSYQQSCRNFTASKGTLTAECQTASGSWNNTTLAEYRGCSGDISNKNGALTCARAPGTEGANTTGGDNERGNRGDRGGRDGTSGGTGSSTAAGSTGGSGSTSGSGSTAGGGSTGGAGPTAGAGSTGDRTGASGDGRGGARDRDRTETNSNVDDNDRAGRDDGDRGRGDGDRGRGDWDRAGWQPPGSYQETCRRIQVERGDLEADCRTRSGSWRHSELDKARECRGDIANDNGRLVCARVRNTITLYQDNRFGGQRRTYNDDQPSLRGFANIASSANVQGGRWQLCTRTNYRGRCVTIDTTVRNFNALGINDRIQSLRRVR